MSFVSLSNNIHNFFFNHHNRMWFISAPLIKEEVHRLELK